MHLRADKCLHVWQPKPMREIPARRYPAVWSWWGVLRDKTRAKASKCLSATLMDWYYNSGAKCVHEHEGAWNDPNAPYWGGFQADLSFQATYNPGAYRTYGTADHWPVVEQIEMAHNGWQARGWSPWPNTAAACGLL